MPYSGLYLPSGPQSENQKKRNERQVLGVFQRTKKVLEHDCDGATNYNWHTWNGLEKLGKVVERVGNSRPNRDHLNSKIVEISQNSEKSPLDLRRRAERPLSLLLLLVVVVVVFLVLYVSFSQQP